MHIIINNIIKIYSKYFYYLHITGGVYLGKNTRSLKNDRLVEDFVINVMGFTNKAEISEAINLITEAEGILDEFENKNTLIFEDFRSYGYVTKEERAKLREQIVMELITKERPVKDDDMQLGIGGAKPINKTPQRNKKAYFVIGLPASGKSGICNIIADSTCSYIIDSDMVKRKLPEYYTKKGGATLVHTESDILTFEYKDYNGNMLNLFNYCVESGYNIVVPKIGHKIENIIDFSENLVVKGYKVYLILVDLNRTKATIRAYNRFKEEKRYVPLSLIFDGYADSPSLNYFKLKEKKNVIFSGFLHLDNDVAKGELPIIVNSKNIRISNLGFGTKGGGASAKI